MATMRFEPPPAGKTLPNPFFEELFGKKAGHMRMGLERTTQALHCLHGACGRRLEDGTLVFLVGGTNGKGSTSGFLFHLFASLGAKVGLYSSPHLTHYRERFFLNTDGRGGRMAEDAEIERHYLHLKGSLLPPEIFAAMSFFELSTLIAYRMFMESGLDVAIFEVGLGGRLDSTNAIDPDCSAVTSIDFDHMEYLGRSLPEIAREKAAIRRPGRPLAWGEEEAKWGREYPEVIRGILDDGQEFRARGVDFGHDRDRVWCSPKPAGSSGDSFGGRREVAFLPVPARWQTGPEYLRRNLALAWMLFHLGLRSGKAPAGLDTALEARVSPGMQSAAADVWHDPIAARTAYDFGDWHQPPEGLAPTLIGRGDARVWRSQHGSAKEWRLYLDACHNLAGCVALSEAVAARRAFYGDGCEAALVTILKDKAVNEMLDLLREVCPRVLLFQVPGERSITAEDIASRHRDLPLFPDFGSLWLEIQNDQSDRRSLVVCGSIYGLGDVLRLIGHELIEDPGLSQTQ